MTQETINAIEKLADAVGKTGAEITNYYTTWFITASIIWGIFGLAFMVVPLLVKFKIDEGGDVKGTNIPHAVVLVVKGIMVFIGAIILCNNIIDLLAPEGIAIHQLITDLRG